MASPESGRVAHTALDGVRLDPAQRRAHRPVVRLDDSLVVAHHRHEGHRLRRAQRHVPAGPVRDAVVEFLAPETAPARNLAFENPLERLRIDPPGPPKRSPRDAPRRHWRSSRPSRNSPPPAPARRSCRWTLPSDVPSAGRGNAESEPVHTDQICARAARNKGRTDGIILQAPQGAESPIPPPRPDARCSTPGFARSMKI